MSSTNRSSRKHKSTRIPGVVMRPAPAPPAETSKAAAARERQRLADAEDAEHFRRLTDRPVEDGGEAMDTDDPGADVARGIKPMRNVKLCLSGCSEERYQLKSMIEALGGTFTADLTRDTTHLLAATPGSAKWFSARQHGMHVLHPNWLHEISERYKNDQELEIDRLTNKHKLRPLESFRILLCLSRFNGKDHDPKVFQALRLRFEQLGAQCVPFNLDPGGITHVVCMQDSLNGSTTSHPRAIVALRQWAASQSGSNFGRGVDNVKIEEQRELATKLLQGMVWLEWMEDCERVNDYLAPAPYLAEKTRPPSLETRLRAAWSSLAQFKDPVQASEAVSLAPTERVLRGTSDSGIVKATHPKLRDLITTITATKERSQSPALKPNVECRSDEPEPLKALSQGDRADESVSSLVRARRVLQGQGGIKQHGKGVERSVERTESEAVVQALDATEKKMSPDHEMQGDGEKGYPHLCGSRTEDASKTVFLRGLNIAIDSAFGEDVIPKIGALIKEHGGQTISLQETDTRLDYCIVVLRGPSPEYSSVPTGKLVTHLWLERCAYEERLVDPLDANFVGMTPACTGVVLPLFGAERVALLLSGLRPDSPDEHHIRTVASALGVSRVIERAKRAEMTHVLCLTDKAREGPKAQKAREWGKPVVGLDFFRRALSEGVLDPPAPSTQSLVQEQQRRTRSGSSTAAESNTNVLQQPTSELLSLVPSKSKESSTAVCHRPQSVQPKEAPKRKSSLLSGGAEPKKRILDANPVQSTPPRAAGLSDHTFEASEHVGDGFSLAAQITADEVFAMLDARRTSPTPTSRSAQSGAGNASGGRKLLRPDRDRDRARGVRSMTHRGSSPAVPPPPLFGEAAEREAERLLRARREADALRESSFLDADGELEQDALALLDGDAARDGGMRITYDDPTERKERERLRSLVEKAGKKKELELELARKVVANAKAPTHELSVSPAKTQGEAMRASKSPSKSPTVPRKDHFGEGRQWSKEAMAARRAQEDWSKVKARRQPGTASRK